MNKKNKAPRNKTIDFSIDEAQKYLDKCVSIGELKRLQSIRDITVMADTFEALPCLNEKSIDLIIVDPPYNLTKNYHGNIFSKKTKENYEEYTVHWLKMVKRLLKPKGSIYICCDWQSSIIIGNILPDYFIVRNRITWQREKGRGSRTNWKNQMEDIWYCTNSDEYTFNYEAVKHRKKVIAPYRIDGEPKDWVDNENGKYRDTFGSNFWNDISIPFWSMPENTAHPTQKPEKLIAKLILASSNENDIILDPFLGSGTTSVVAKKLNRHFIGIEQNPIYCAFTIKRLNMADVDNKIQGYYDRVFWQRNSI